MKNRFRNVILYLPLVLIISGIHSSCIDKETKSVELSIEPEFNDYLIKEDIWIKVSLKNNSENKYLLKHNFTFGNILFEITAPDEKKVHKVSSLGPMNTIDTIVLEPNSEMHRNVQLGHYFPNGTNLEGDYKITAIFGDLKSNELILSVKSPQGVEKEVFETMLEDVTLDENYFNNAAKRWESILKDYPSTRYSPQLYNKLFSKLSRTKEHETDYNRIQSNLDNYLQNNYNRLGTEFIITDYSFCLSYFVKMSNEDIRNKLIELSNSYKGTATENIVNNFVSENFPI